MVVRRSPDDLVVHLDKDQNHNSEHEINRQQKTNHHGHMKQTKNPSNNEMRFIGPRSHLEEEYPVDMVALNLTNRSRKDAGPLGGLRDQYEQVRGKVGELENIGNLGAQLSFEQRKGSDWSIQCRFY